MSHRRFCFLMLSLAALVPCAFAQRGGGRGAAAPAGSSAPRPVDITATRSFDMASVERGGKVFAAQCASCHGDNARGGKGTKTDMDLLRSEIVVMDHAGRELPEFLKLGRPGKNMPKFDLSHDEGVEVSAWLHYQVSLVTLWNQYTKLNIFSGDAKAGEAFFNGSVGKCGTCHSVTGDLKGIGREAHALKGSVDMLGFERMTLIASMLEIAGKETSDLHACQTLVRDLAQAFVEVEALCVERVGKPL